MAPAGDATAAAAPQRHRGHALRALAAATAAGLAALAPWSALAAGPNPTTAPGGLVAPAGTPVGVAAAEITYDFRTGKRGFLAIAPEVTATYTLENPSSQDTVVPVAVLYDRGLNSPYYGDEFQVTWLDRETRVRADLGRVYQEGPPYSLGAVPLQYLHPETGRAAGNATARGPFMAYKLLDVTVPAHGTGALTVRYKHSYTACSACGAREPHWYWTVPLSIQQGWAYVRRLQVVALVPPDVDFATAPALVAAPGPGPDEQTYTADLAGPPRGDLHLAAVLQRRPRVFEDWPWYTAATAVAGGALYWQYRTAVRARQRPRRP